MRTKNSATAHNASPIPVTNHGLAWGALGVFAFSFSIPFTRIADRGLDPLVVGCGRAVIAALLAAVALRIGGARLPTPREWLGLVPVAFGVVAGFPILTSLALQHTESGHSAVVIGLLPAATAIGAVLLTGERPSRRFWFGAACGVVATVTFTVIADGVSGVGVDDLYLLGAVALGAMGYAQGGMMSRRLGSWQTVSWALVLALPVMATITTIRAIETPLHATPGEWAAFGYLSAVSMFLGFFAWYRGLAIGPMTTVSQVQLIQPVLTLVWSVLLLGEYLTPTLAIGALTVIVVTAFTVRSRVAPVRHEFVLPDVGHVGLDADRLVDERVVGGDVDLSPARDGVQNQAEHQPTTQHHNGVGDLVSVEESDVAQQRAQRPGRQQLAQRAPGPGQEVG